MDVVIFILLWMASWVDGDSGILALLPPLALPPPQFPFPDDDAELSCKYVPTVVAAPIMTNASRMILGYDDHRTECGCAGF